MLVLLASFALLPAQTPMPPSSFLHSAVGPRPGESATGIGARAYSVRGFAEFVDGVSDEVASIPVPMIEVSHVVGLSDDWSARVRLATIGIGSVFDVGARWRIAGDERFSLALTGDLVVAHIVPLTIAVSPTPGMQISTGSENQQLSLALDLPITAFTATLEGQVNVGPIAGVRASLTWEIATSDVSVFYAQARLTGLTDLHERVLLPSVAVGVTL